MEILMILAVGALNIACFFVGTKLGQKVAKGEPIEGSLPNPLEDMRKREAAKEAKREQDKIDTIMRNIESYDGTERGQEDVPRG